MDALDAAVEATEDQRNPVAIGRAAAAAQAADRVSSVRDALWRVASTSRTSGPCPPALGAAAALAAESFLAGRWNEATLIAEEGRTFSELLGYQLASQGFRRNHALVMAARGRDDVIDDITSDVSSWAAPRGARLLQLRCHRVHALRALGRGEFEDAYQHARVVCVARRPGDKSPLALEGSGSV